MFPERHNVQNPAMFPPRRNVYNPEWATLLHDSLEHLWDGVSTGYGKERFICFALINGAYSPNEDRSVLFSLQREIAERLTVEGEEFSTLSVWCDVVHKKVLTTTELQALRRAWMLDMIEEFGSRS